MTVHYLGYYYPARAIDYDAASRCRSISFSVVAVDQEGVTWSGVVYGLKSHRDGPFCRVIMGLSDQPSSFRDWPHTLQVVGLRAVETVGEARVAEGDVEAVLVGKDSGSLRVGELIHVINSIGCYEPVQPRARRVHT